MSNVESKNQKSNGLDLILDGWLNSYKVFQSFQTEIAEKSLQHLHIQRDILNSTRETFSKIEEDKNKFEEEWKAVLQNTIKSINNEQIERLLSAWVNQIEEINSSIKEISGLPNQAILDLFAQSHVQLETNVKAALEQQQKNSVEVFHKVELLTEHIKQAHHVLLPTV
ncbi:hypothetical protein AM499_19905 [Bacillus sp. FJAT-22090]|uniref:hypothetical protein n=1 Tax=Bacillus sp. FJAT-22090 TaxID=1581038 RepID=UPI0006AFBD33|nr:hypothetical protein [Bacillus sp. FJAT-22090]ALC87812.1 hypothetical protein AM499_19905 [Bacillus sp. FJAT-22090]